VVLQSVQLNGATNHDFEAITRDARGRLYLADTGDNGRTREAYQIYQFSADIPTGASAVTTVRFNFRYEDNRPRDCEAMIAFEGKLYLLTKQETYESYSEVFVLDISEGGGGSRAKFLGRMKIKGRVTDAAYSSARKMLAVLTYHGVALYDFVSLQDLFAEPKHYAFGSFGKCESVCFDHDYLVVTNEEAQMWKQPIDDFLAKTWMGAARPKQKLAYSSATIRLDGRTDDWPAESTEFALTPEREGVTHVTKIVASPLGWHVAISMPYRQRSHHSKPIGDTLFVMVSPDVDRAFPAASTSIFAITLLEGCQKAKVFRMRQPLPWEGRGNWKSQSSPAGLAAIQVADGKLTIEALIDNDNLRQLAGAGDREIRCNVALLSWQGRKPHFWSWAGPLRGRGDEKLQSWGIVSVSGR